MSNIKIEFGFGTEFSVDGRWIEREDTRMGLLAIRARALELFQGCTWTYTVGDWIDLDTLKNFREDGISLSVLTEDTLLAERVNALVACIKTEFDQKAVAVTMYSVAFEIV